MKHPNNTEQIYQANYIYFTKSKIPFDDKLEKSILDFEDQENITFLKVEQELFPEVCSFFDVDFFPQVFIKIKDTFVKITGYFDLKQLSLAINKATNENR